MKPIRALNHMDLRQQRRFLNCLVILSSLIGYLEWGGNNSAFLFEAETELILRSFSDPASVLHPLTILPMAGQTMLGITVFQHNPSYRLSYWGIAGLGLLITLISINGLISLSLKIFCSTLPFMMCALFALSAIKKQKRLALQSLTSKS